MSVDEEDPGGLPDGWIGAAVAVVVVSAAAVALLSMDWRSRAAPDQLYRSDATRQLVMVPLPR